MADRIFPTQFQSNALDSEKVFTGIDWDNFGSRLAQVREAEGKGMSDEVKRYLESLKNDETDFDDTETEDTEAVTAKKKLPDALKEHQFKPTKEDVDDEDMDDDEDDEKDDEKEDMDDDEKENKKIVRGKEASARSRRKIVFSNARQLSAEAIEAAKAAGDYELMNTILAARNARRQALAARIEESAREQMERSAKIAKRHAYRMAIVNSVEAVEKKIAEATAKMNNVRAASEEDGFVKISDLKGASREAFIKKCAINGFPPEYVAAMLGESEAAFKGLSPAGERIKNVMASALDKEIKQAAVEGLVKTAKLSDADYERLRKYWKEELGYGDEEWIDDLFSNKYDK